MTIIEKSVRCMRNLNAAGNLTCSIRRKAVILKTVVVAPHETKNFQEVLDRLTEKNYII